MFPRDPLPDRIGPYRILRRLASRRGADLYLGRHEGPMGFARECVLKLVPRPDITEDPGSAQELAHEAKICARLNHPAVVRMHDFFEHGGHLVLVFEHFAGVSLARLLSHYRRRRQRVPDSAVWYLAHRLFAALSHAHAMTSDAGRPTPVIHRDVQPAHLVMSSDGQVRLAGFGIAKIEGAEGTTAIGFVKGTPAYMAPEQARGEKVTERVDVYAAGLVVWEMLSGRPVRPPRDVAHGADLLKLIAGRRFDAITMLRRDIPREIGAAIDACLEVDPRKRGISCAEVERWLDKVVDVDAGRRELRERLVQLRSATLRATRSTTLSGRTASGIPRASGPPESLSPTPSARAMPSRFPGLAKRLTGRPSELAEGDPLPRSSRRAPPLRSVPPSRPAPPWDHLDEDDMLSAQRPMPASASPGFAPDGTPSSHGMRSMLGLAPNAPMRPVDRRAPPTASRRAAPHAAQVPATQPVAAPPMAAPPMASAPSAAAPGVAPAAREDADAFVARLRKPPGVQSAAPGAAPPAQRVGPVAEPTDAFGDTTLISRRRLFERRSRLLLLAAAGLGGLLLALVAVAGVLALRPDSPKAPMIAESHSAAIATGPGSAPALIPAVATPPATAAASAVAAAAPPAATPPAVAPKASAEQEEPEPPVAADQNIPPPPPSLGGLGLLYMQSPPEGTVYISGVPMGETDEWFHVSCGKHHFIRVGTKPGPRGLSGVSWLAPGQSILIRCGTAMQAAATPRYPVPERPAGGSRPRSRYEPKAPF